MGPDERSISFSLALSIGIKHRNARYDVMPGHAAKARCALGITCCLNTLLWAALVS